MWANGRWPSSNWLLVRLSRRARAIDAVRSERRSVSDPVSACADGWCYVPPARYLAGESDDVHLIVEQAFLTKISIVGTGKRFGRDFSYRMSKSDGAISRL